MLLFKLIIRFCQSENYILTVTDSVCHEMNCPYFRKVFPIYLYLQNYFPYLHFPEFAKRLFENL